MSQRYPNYSHIHQSISQATFLLHIWCEKFPGNTAGGSQRGHHDFCKRWHTVIYPNEGLCPSLRQPIDRLCLVRWLAVTCVPPVLTALVWAAVTHHCGGNNDWHDAASADRNRLSLDTFQQTTSCCVNITYQNIIQSTQPPLYYKTNICFYNSPLSLGPLEGNQLGLY
jgi:hypothetical protein